MKYEKGMVFENTITGDHLIITQVLPQERSYIGGLLYTNKKQDGTKVLLPAHYVEESSKSTKLKISETQLDRTGKLLGKRGEEGVPEFVFPVHCGPAEV